MRIFLIDADSKIPNIALMKLSTYHKNLGDTVDFIKLDGENFEYEDTHDIAYASIIFTKNKDNIKGNVIIGGTGVSLEMELPKEVEHLFPDYSLYPDNKFSIGYLTRGCCRNCSFCIVPEKEGLIKFYAHTDEFIDKNLPFVRILDNNILSYHGWRDLFIELKKVNKRIKFENFDFRLLTEEMLIELRKIKFYGNYIFALDNPKDIPIYNKKIWLLEKYFPVWYAKFDVLVAYDTSLKEDIERIKFLLSHKIYPYILRYETYKQSEYKHFYIDLAAWCNQPQFVKKMTFRQFMNVRYKEGHPRIKEESDLFESLWKKV